MASAMLRQCVQPIKTTEINKSNEPNCINVISVSSGVECGKFYVSLMQLGSSHDVHIVKIPIDCVPELLKQITSLSINLYTKSIQDAVYPDCAKDSENKKC